MPKSTESTSSGEAVDEAIRALTEASRRGADGAERVVSTSNSLLTDSFATNRQLFQTWAAGLEAMLTAGFEMQKSLLNSAPPLLDAMLAANKSVVKAWTALSEQQQDAVLRAWRSTLETTSELGARSA